MWFPEGLKISDKSRYPELMYKIYCFYPPGYLVQCHLCFIEGISLSLEARKDFLAEINLLRFHYTWLNAINSTEIDALWFWNADVKITVFPDIMKFFDFDLCNSIVWLHFQNWKVSGLFFRIESPLLIIPYIWSRMKWRPAQENLREHWTPFSLSYRGITTIISQASLRWYYSGAEPQRPLEGQHSGELRRLCS